MVDPEIRVESGFGGGYTFEIATMSYSYASYSTELNWIKAAGSTQLFCRNVSQAQTKVMAQMIENYRFFHMYLPLLPPTPL